MPHSHRCCFAKKAERDAIARAYGGRQAHERATALGQTELSYDEWLTVRTPAFKVWFGDWEAARAEQRLDSMTPVTVPVPDEWRDLPLKDLRRGMNENLRSLMANKEIGKAATPIVHPEFGTILVGTDGFKKTRSTSADPAKILIAANLPSILPHAIYSHSELLNKPKSDTRITGYATLYAKVDVIGIPLIAVFTIERKTDADWYYNTVARYAENAKTREFQAGGVTSKPVQGSPLAGLREGKREPLARVNREAVCSALNPNTAEPTAQAVRDYENRLAR